MISVQVSYLTLCNIPESKIAEKIKSTFVNHGVKSGVVDVAVVDRDEMLALVEKYMDEHGDEAKEHPVLSFVDEEVEGSFVVGGGNRHFGNIVISYPHAVDIAKSEGKTSKEAVLDLAEHAALHIIGIHHD